ncbi:hypothetical protein [Leptolyngbya ohadii]|uniref:hypothetical protein n=1 Tax=Leptolyngbya ohadii TaxID=1962290 RepID=UPI0015C61C19|nr:hypothetical protein [Leptolyngbya ohadii]
MINSLSTAIAYELWHSYSGKPTRLRRQCEMIASFQKEGSHSHNRLGFLSPPVLGK